MDFNALKLQILHGSMFRRLLLRAFLFALIMAVLPLLQVFREPVELFADFDDCALYVRSTSNQFPGRFLESFGIPAFAVFKPSQSSRCKENANLTKNVFRELMDKKFLDSGAKALCIGEGSALLALRELGFSKANGVHQNSFFSLKRKQVVYELEFQDRSFDFVFSRDFDKVSVPALLVIEVERVLRPGGIGAMLVGVGCFNQNTLIRSATPVSSFLRNSNVVHVSSVNSSILVVFKKKLDHFDSLEHYQLPKECPSVKSNKPFMAYIEPLMYKKPVGLESRFSYLPNFMNVSSSKQFIYINIGVKETVNPNVTDWFPPSYPLQSHAFQVYFVDHNVTILSSYVKKPGITFVYHPGLAGNRAAVDVNPDEELSPLMDDEGFDFVAWFGKTVTADDFVVLKMNAEGVELELLFELFQTGAICLVDELFLRCPDEKGDENAVLGNCIDLFRDLRGGGVWVHQVWGS